MKEFKVNDYISLKLEHVESDEDFKGSLTTVIYVNSERFKQCKFLLLDIPVENISVFDEIQSIDEAEEIINRPLTKEEEYSYLLGNHEENAPSEKIAPEVEFWGHCSNMQVWFENDYNTRLLHRYLAFPLLRKLTEAGDPVAKKVFKEEIAKRYTSGHPSVIGFLKNGGYLEYLTAEEIGAIIDDLKSREVKTEYVTYKRRVCEFVLSGRLRLRKYGIKDITDIEGLDSLKSLRRLDLSYNQIIEIKGLENLENLEFLNLNKNQITEIKGLENLKNLKTLFLQDNQITKIKGLEKLKNLEHLWLINNEITKIECLENLRKLGVLGLETNPIPQHIIDELGGLDKIGRANKAQNFVEYCKKSFS